MTPEERKVAAVATARLQAALADGDQSVRMRTAMAAGTSPEPEYVEVLVARCAVEPDFFVRDTLTWALGRHSADLTVPSLLAELRTDRPQARSQALHTLSKIGDPRGWQAITAEVLQDPDDEVARSAWRAAVVLVPAELRSDLAVELATQLGRGDREVQLSLSRALTALGSATDGALATAAESSVDQVRTHALATQRMVSDPDESFDAALFDAALFDAALFEATRTLALLDVPAETGRAAPGPVLLEVDVER